MTAACKKAKISRQRAYEVRDEDEVFDAAWKEALEVATENLELEARRRAEIGVLEPVFYLGKKAGSIRKYSDTLMIFLLKAHKPDTYRENVRHEHDITDRAANSAAALIAAMRAGASGDLDE